MQAPVLKTFSKAKMNKLWTCLNNYEKTLKFLTFDEQDEEEELAFIQECKELVKHW